MPSRILAFKSEHWRGMGRCSGAEQCVSFKLHSVAVSPLAVAFLVKTLSLRQRQHREFKPEGLKSQAVDNRV